MSDVKFVSKNLCKKLPECLKHNYDSISNLTYFLACIGSWGRECGNKCSYGYYGIGCRRRCSCSDRQICDPKQGRMDIFKGK